MLVNRLPIALGRWVQESWLAVSIFKFLRSEKSPPTGLSRRQLANYQRDGFLFPLRAMSPNQATEGAAKYEDIVNHFGDDARGTGPMTKRPHLYLRWVADLARSRTIVDAVEDIIGPDIMCWSSTFFVKEPGDGLFLTWHQDGKYWNLSNTDVVSAWVALTPATHENGAMKFLPESHHELVDHVQRVTPKNMLMRGHSIVGDIDPSKVVDVELNPGEFALLHVNLPHASEPNLSPHRRVGLVFRYIAGSVYQKTKRRDSASLIRGRDLTGKFVHEEMPASDCDANALAFHAKARARDWPD